MKLTAVAILAALAAQRPTEYRDDPQRIATIAVAIEESSESEFIRGALATAAIKESGLWRSVHTGERRGRAGEICLVQIHPVNIRWKRTTAPSFEALAGTGLEATRWCFQTAAMHLAEGVRYCRKRRYIRNLVPAMWTFYHVSKCWLSPHAFERAALQSKISSTRWVVTPEHERLVAAVRHHAQHEASEVEPTQHQRLSAALARRVESNNQRATIEKLVSSELCKREGCSVRGAEEDGCYRHRHVDECSPPSRWYSVCKLERAR